MTMIGKYRVVNNWGNGYRIQRYSRHWLFWEKWKFVEKKRDLHTVESIITMRSPLEFYTEEDARIIMEQYESEESQKTDLKTYGWRIPKEK